MSDENPKPQPDLSAQFRELGENIKNFFQSAWESEESQKFRDELQNGLDELGRATNETFEEIKTSEAGKKIKAETDDFIQRVEAGQVEAKAREEISKVLDFINTELGNLNQKIKPKETAAPPPESVEWQEESNIEDEK